MAPGVPLETSLTEAAFLRGALRAKLRPDGRSLLEPLPLSISLGATPGSATVRLGTALVLAHTHAELVAPRAERPYEGFVDVRAEVQPIAGPQFERGRAGEEEVRFERGIDRAIRRSEAIDREALCVVAGQKVWAVTLNVHLLSSGGPLASLDCAVLASLLSLRHFRRPDATVEGGPAPRPRRGPAAASAPPIAHADRARVVLHDPDERAAVPLALHHTPLCVSLAVFELDAEGTAGGSGSSDAEAILLDASPLEAAQASASIHVVCTPQGEVCAVDKAGGAPLSADTLERAIDIARRRVRELAKIVDDELERDAQQRAVEVPQ